MKVYVAIFYGLAIVASGLVRYLGQEGGDKGLWFGIVFGALAWIAALFLARSRQLIGMCLLWSCVLFVGGWFVYEALIKKGFSEAEPRMLVIIGITVAVAIYNLSSQLRFKNVSSE